MTIAIKFTTSKVHPGLKFRCSQKESQSRIQKVKPEIPSDRGKTKVEWSLELTNKSSLSSLQENSEEIS